MGSLFILWLLTAPGQSVHTTSAHSTLYTVDIHSWRQEVNVGYHVQFNYSLPYLLRQAFSLNLELTSSTRLASQWTPEISLFLSVPHPQFLCLPTPHPPPHTPTLYGCWKSELRSSYIKSKYFTHCATSPGSYPALWIVFFLYDYNPTATALKITQPCMIGKTLWSISFWSLQGNVYLPSNPILSWGNIRPEHHLLPVSLSLNDHPCTAPTGRRTISIA